MAELILKSRRFREERESDWRKLSQLLERLEKGGYAKLSDDELIALPVLYRATLSSLSVARATSLDQALLDYLEALCTRAYFLVYGVRTSPLEQASRFFRHDWPKAVQSLGRETLAAFAILALGIFLGYSLVHANPDWYFSFVPQGLAQGRDPSASTGMLRDTLYKTDPLEQQLLAIFATFLFTHNAQVALLTFALGFMLCLPTVFLQLMTGGMMGAMMALFASHGLGLPLAAWLSIHGTTELFAITLASAAGFRIGWAVAFPGRLARVDAMLQSGRQTGPVMIGVLVMLFVAGILEGVGRQTINLDWGRFAVGGVMLAVWLSYFYLPRGETRP
jgi:uncharacterized membrane protein SpoIIM required for sporulation